MEPSKPRLAAAQPPLVLIVEDYGDALELLSELLMFRGFRVAGAQTGQAALEMARAIAPDVVVMDLTLPDIDGREVTRRLKACPETAHIPVVALTAYPQNAHGDSVRAAGFDGYVSKPCRPDQLVDTLLRLLPAAPLPATAASL